jgi:hypothetical protein
MLDEEVYFSTHHPILEISKELFMASQTTPETMENATGETRRLCHFFLDGGEIL